MGQIFLPKLLIGTSEIGYYSLKKKIMCSAFLPRGNSDSCVCSEKYNYVMLVYCVSTVLEIGLQLLSPIRNVTKM